MHAAHSSTLFGLLAEFESVEKLNQAARKIRDAGYKAVDAYSPFPMEEIRDNLGLPKTKLPLLVLIAGISGFCLGFGLQVFCSAIDYPINIGGRPLISVPSFIPISFEVTVLCASFTAAFGMLILNGFPRPYHPVFNVERFKSVTTDGLFISIEATDPKFEKGQTSSFLKSCGAKDVFEIVE